MKVLPYLFESPPCGNYKSNGYPQDYGTFDNKDKIAIIVQCQGKFHMHT